MRTIKLTHEEIETIKMALQYVYDRNLEIVSQHRKMLGEEAVSKILEKANRFFDTQDVFDGETYKWFQNQMRANEKFIGIQFCWDGADTTNTHMNKSMWPLCVSILNFPKDLRDKVGIGMHVVSLCSYLLRIYCRLPLKKKWL